LVNAKIGGVIGKGQFGGSIDSNSEEADGHTKTSLIIAVSHSRTSGDAAVGLVVAIEGGVEGTGKDAGLRAIVGVSGHSCRPDSHIGTSRRASSGEIVSVKRAVDAAAKGAVTSDWVCEEGGGAIGYAKPSCVQSKPIGSIAVRNTDWSGSHKLPIKTGDGGTDCYASVS
jgi:hypothetical protein